MNYTDAKCIYCKGKGVTEENTGLVLCHWCQGHGIYSETPIDPQPDHRKNPVIEEVEEVEVVDEKPAKVLVNKAEEIVEEIPKKRTRKTK